MSNTKQRLTHIERKVREIETTRRKSIRSWVDLITLLCRLKKGEKLDWSKYEVDPGLEDIVAALIERKRGGNE